MHRRSLAPGLGLAALLLTAPRPASGVDLKKRYEAELIRWALQHTGLEREPQPEGKRIARVVIVREDIIADSDPWPNFLNIFHVKTREYIVRQELLLREGDRWDPERVAETERNLRALFILAVARTVPCKGKRDDEVVWLVITKDIWSIRLNIAFSQTGTLVSLFDITPTEANFLGRNKRLSLHLRLSQVELEAPAVRDHVAVGFRYTDPRVLGTRLRFIQTVDAIFDGKVPCGGETTWRFLVGRRRVEDRSNLWCPSTTSGELAGVAATVSLGRPLFSLSTKWAFSIGASVDIRQRRLYQQDTGSLVLATRTPDLVHFVPFVYDGRRYESALSITRSFGTSLKHDISWGIASYRRRYAPPEGFPFDAAIRRWFVQNHLPFSETAAVFGVGYTLRTTRFVRLRNVQGFALSEDFSIGPGVSLNVDFGQNLERSKLSFIAMAAAASYRWQLGDDLLTLSASASTRWQPNLEEEGFSPPWVNSTWQAGIRNVSPRIGIGRLHAQALISFRDDDLGRGFFSLGGDAGLRGYPNDQFIGDNLLRFNLEYRTLPINLFTLHLGGVVFYDGGAVFDGPDPGRPGEELPLSYRQSVGLGIRGHFPQFDRESLRIDLGFPLSDERGGFSTWFSLSFGQVF